MLSNEGIATYLNEGLVVVKTKLSYDFMSEMRADIASFLPENQTQIRDFVPGLMDAGFGLKFGGRPEILDIVTQLIGSNIILWACSIFGKPAKNGKATPWHQDAAYWPIYPMAGCTVWIAIDDSLPENGCLCYIPGSHKLEKIFTHSHQKPSQFTISQAIEASDLNLSYAKEALVKNGYVSIHDSLLIHSSKPNYSSQRRAAVTFRYMPTSSYYDHEQEEIDNQLQGKVRTYKRILYLVRGRDICGRNVVTYPPL